MGGDAAGAAINPSLSPAMTASRWLWTPSFDKIDFV
jgi:hypothetical protein